MVAPVCLLAPDGVPNKGTLRFVRLNAPKTSDIVDVAEKKFGVEFNLRLFLEQLVFLDDVEDTGIQFFKTSVTRAELLSFFEAHTRANAERL